MPSIFNYPKFHAETTLGLPLVGGKVYTYAPGTTTPKASYQDAAMSAANTNPVILDANGDAVIYLNGVYDVVLKDSSDVSQWTMSSVTGGNTSDDYEVDVLYKYGGGTTYTQAVINLALAAVGTSTKTTLLFRPGTWVISSNANWSAYTNIVWKLAPGAIWQIATGTTTTLAGAVEAGDYQVFSCVGTGKVVFGENSVERIYARWFYSGTGDYESSIEAALNSVTYGTPIPVYLPAGLITVAGTITLPLGAILRGANSSMQTSATDSGTYIYHAPTGAGVDLFQTTTSALNSVELSDFYIVGSTSTGTSRIGISYSHVLSGKIRNVRISGAFATAGLVFDSCQDVDVDNLMVVHSGATAMAAAILFQYTDTVTTTVRFRGLYIGGRNGNATGGITDGVVMQKQSAQSVAFYSPIMESIKQYAFNIYKRNYVDIWSPHIENVPTVDAATPIFRIGKDGATGDGLGRTFVNIAGGFIGGPNVGYSTNFGFDVDLSGVGGNLNISGVHFQGLPKFMYFADTDIGRVTIKCCYDSGVTTSFGTIAKPASLEFDSSNIFSAVPSAHLGAGLFGNLPAYNTRAGQRFFSTSYFVDYIHSGTDVKSFTYDTGTHEPTIGQVLYGQTSGAVISLLAKTNSGGWGGAGTGTLYYSVISGTPANGEHFHEAASGAGTLICNTTSANTNAVDTLGWKIQPGGGLSATLDDTGTPDLSDGLGGLVPVANNFVTGGTTAITDFLHGQVGQIICILAAHSVTITDCATIILAGGTNFNMVATDTLTLQYLRTYGAWVELSRSVN